ncbi:transcriptional regulator with XRE-family HTH domain [Nocardia tenerifensis]|uniref:Transcriptional regulator with XRE-family HTH domain n=1 Tax=Nocardia tenerifensis TaxID=228006 RepID=A0A318JXC2_9NOCA|nr:helix-turn-helix transcriptional regulator [Nocardia tenerifensis]PXX59673.1 transcriptional regulator with XRE-family HTH domain [Nocardia tenerifensis]
MAAVGIGERIAIERHKAGKKQAQLAKLMDYSIYMVQAVEQGKKRPSPGFIAAAAKALGIDQEVLRGTPYRDTLEEDGTLEGITELRAILCEGEYVQGVEPPPVAELQATMQRVNDEDRKGNSRKALAQLPMLIRQLYGALHNDPDDPVVYELLCSAYNAADRMCRRFGFMSLTIPAVDRYDWAAAHSGDPLASAVGKVMRTRLLVYQHSIDLALTLVDRALEEARGDSEDALSVLGAAHLAGAVAAARGLRLDVARAHITEARAIGARLGFETRSYETLFGPANTEIHAVGVELEAGDPGKAARQGSELILPASIAKTRAGHLWQDIAAGFVMTGQREKAIKALNVARKIAPQQTKLHPSVRETLQAIAASEKRSTGSTAEFARWLGVSV